MVACRQQREAVPKEEGRIGMPTKLGPHILRDAADLQDYLQSKPAVVKVVGSWGLGASVPEGVLVIGRKHELRYDAQLQRETGKSPFEAAQQFVQDQLPTYRENAHIEYWEGHNEPVWSTNEQMAWYAQFEVERMRLMAAEGLKCVIGNFASGAPPLTLWPAFFPALRAAQIHQAILGLHEYSCPVMWWMTGGYQLNPEEDEGDEGWTTLRYRKVYRKYLIPNGYGDVPLVITECGIDPLVNPKPPGAGVGGTWRQLGHYWSTKHNEQDKEDFYFRQLVWYDNELQKDDFVLGATVFTWGSFGQPWSEFDVAGTNVAKKLISYTQQNPAESFVYASHAVARPRGDPREPYERTYVLLPPGADATWARAVVEATWDERRWTVGSSADDAGIGNLEKRSVVAVNPSSWPTDLAAFFGYYYTGAAYHSVEADSPVALKAQLRALPTPLPESAPSSRRRGVPRAQYERTYVLLPPDTSSEWAAAVVDATWDEHRYTVGSSADDAGIGDLDNRRVVAINPRDWPSDLRAFFEEHYPGVDYSEVQAGTAAELVQLLAV
jgi:hypothetical protein